MPKDAQTGDRYIKLDTPPGDTQVVIQRVRHASRVHLDIETDSIESEVDRLLSLGATIVSRNEAWVVMQAPSGHRFCVGSPYREGFEQHANTWE